MPPVQVITATPRQLESMVRIAEALARMRLSETVESGDVEEAVRLIKVSCTRHMHVTGRQLNVVVWICVTVVCSCVQVAMQQSATDPATGAIDMVQPILSRALFPA